MQHRGGISCAVHILKVQAFPSIIYCFLSLSYCVLRSNAMAPRMQTSWQLDSQAGREGGGRGGGRISCKLVEQELIHYGQAWL